MTISFEQVAQSAFERHGGWRRLEKKLVLPLSAHVIKDVADDRWLSTMSKCIFQAGFNWNLIEKKWPHFEEAFHQFNIARLVMQSDEDIDNLMKHDGIVKNYSKLKSVRENASFLRYIIDEHLGAGIYFSTWQVEHYVDNLRYLQKNTHRLGGKTGQVFLRRMGVDTLVFTPDVVKALTQLHILEGKTPSSNKVWSLLQANLDNWCQETGYSLNKISQLLALSTD